MKEFTREEIIETIEKYAMTSRTNVVSFIIGYNGILTEAQWDTIIELMLEGYFKE